MELLAQPTTSLLSYYLYFFTALNYHLTLFSFYLCDTIHHVSEVYPKLVLFLISFPAPNARTTQTNCDHLQISAVDSDQDLMEDSKPSNRRNSQIIFGQKGLIIII